MPSQGITEQGMSEEVGLFILLYCSFQPRLRGPLILMLLCDTSGGDHSHSRYEEQELRHRQRALLTNRSG